MWHCRLPIPRDFHWTVILFEHPRLESCSCNMSKTIERSCLVLCGPEMAYREWLEYVWIGGADFGFKPKIIEIGDPETGQGWARNVGFGIRERILTAEPHTTIVYTVETGIPVSYHRGTLTFTENNEDGGGPTRVVWRCDYTPKRCCSLFLSILINISFWAMLRNYKRKLETKVDQWRRRRRRRVWCSMAFSRPTSRIDVPILHRPKL